MLPRRCNLEPLNKRISSVLEDLPLHQDCIDHMSYFAFLQPIFKQRMIDHALRYFFDLSLEQPKSMALIMALMEYWRPPNAVGTCEKLWTGPNLGHLKDASPQLWFF